MVVPTSLFREGSIKPYEPPLDLPLKHKVCRSENISIYLYQMPPRILSIAGAYTSTYTSYIFVSTYNSILLL